MSLNRSEYRVKEAKICDCHKKITSLSFIVCGVVSAMQTQLNQQEDTIKDLEEKISATTAEMMKVLCYQHRTSFLFFISARFKYL